MRKENEEVMKEFFIPILILAQSCTMSFNIANTSGRGEDVIDEKMENTPTISPELEVPAF